MIYKPSKHKTAYTRYLNNKKRQLVNGKTWKLTFDEWYQFWLDHGIDKETISGHIDKNSLCLYLIDLNGDFELGNIELVKLGSKRHAFSTRAKGKPRPNAWKIKDPNLHRKYMPFLKARAQANFRGETWLLTFEDWCVLWPDHLWDRRGRGSHQYALTRRDYFGPWDMNNAIVVTRKEQLQRTRQFQLANNLPTSGKRKKS